MRRPPLFGNCQILRAGEATEAFGESAAHPRGGPARMSLETLSPPGLRDAGIRPPSHGARRALAAIRNAAPYTGQSRGPGIPTLADPCKIAA